MSTFIAAYYGECAECGQNVKGDEVHYDADNELVHVKCPETFEEKVMAGAERCPRCFCYHAGECV